MSTIFVPEAPTVLGTLREAFEHFTNRGSNYLAAYWNGDQAADTPVYKYLQIYSHPNTEHQRDEFLQRENRAGRSWQFICGFDLRGSFDQAISALWPTQAQARTQMEILAALVKSPVDWIPDQYWMIPAADRTARMQKEAAQLSGNFHRPEEAVASAL